MQLEEGVADDLTAVVGQRFAGGDVAEVHEDDAADDGPRRGGGIYLAIVEAPLGEEIFQPAFPSR
jgi:hypothetical protein